MDERPKIEIFRPFGEAFELTKRILFQPFDFKKWLVLGFAVFLTSLSGGGFSGFRPPGGGNWINHVSHDREGVRALIEQLGPIWISLIVVCVLVALVIVVALTWVRARGHFVFIDCIVRNRAAIVGPWNEYRVEGNSYFLFSLLVMLAIFGFIILLAVLVIVPAFFLSGHDRHGLFIVPLLIFAVLLLVACFFAAIISFVAPVMYRRRCTAWPAFRVLLSLFGQHFGLFVLYFLFSIVIGIATAIVAMAVTCATCCIAAIPYVGTVILLPVFVLMQSFTLLFLRQFGPDYDVWAGISQPQAPPPSLTPPPIQT
jgi:hypothetical protein